MKCSDRLHYSDIDGFISGLKTSIPSVDVVDTTRKRTNKNLSMINATSFHSLTIF